jgi:CRISPR-associated protein Csb1
MEAKQLLEELTLACRGNASAIRVVTQLLPAGGQADKVFPPTYEGGKYHKEKRRIDGQEVNVVVLDSVQSQANRLEEVLLRAFDAGECKIPVVCVEIKGHGRITALDAPHRISDAIFRDSLYQGTSFRESEIGRSIVQARVNNATAFFRYCPTALIFGTWDSHGGEGVRSAKVQRALTSEIVGLNAVFGVRSSSRIDPLGIQKEAATIYQSETDYWTLDKTQAKQENDQPVPFGKKSDKDKGKPSNIGHGNVKPTLSLPEESGGVTISEAIQTTVLSFVQLRRLRFPGENNHSSAERDAAGRTVLAALALYAITLELEEGYDLRSRCLLLPKEQPQFELLGSTISEVKRFALDKATAKQVLDQAYQHAAEAGLTWQIATTELTPSAKLLELVRLSDAITAEPGE